LATLICFHLCSSPAANFIIKIIKAIRGKESFGLPVGGAAARLLAEIALRDVDRSLFDEGVAFTRYVDDFRIFLSSEEEVYGILASLAESLLAEGLTLNSAKTRVWTKEDYLKHIEEGSSDNGGIYTRNFSASNIRSQSPE
jgi:hypothetical protein